MIPTDILIVGSGAAGLFCALHLPRDKKICIITKDKAERSDSFLAQGGICVLRDDSDYESYFEDTMKAGHYENDPASVEVMIRSSRQVAQDLIACGVEFERQGDTLSYTREGGHSHPRILFHADVTGREITGKLLEAVRKLPNVTFMEHTMMLDLICQGNCCYGAVVRREDGQLDCIAASDTVLASGGIGGLYRHSTNFRHLTGDALAIALKHGIDLQHVDYIQIHPTTFYSEKPGRRFLISESVRGEGAVLLNAKKERFVNELLPRDLVTAAIYKQMEADGTPYVWLSMAPIDEAEIRGHFPNIYQYCLEEGYDVTKEPIPVVPAQHYFMGGIRVDLSSKTSMQRLYAIGETSCNGVHGANRLASNSLLESMVFAARAANDIAKNFRKVPAEHAAEFVSLDQYRDVDALEEEYKNLVLNEIEKERELHEQSGHNETER